MLDLRVKKRFTVTMQNRDGETGRLDVFCYNINLAQQQALEDANNGSLRGTGWTVRNIREVK